MSSGLFYKLFPVPHFLEWPAIGIDISDQSIKYIELEREKNTLGLKRYGEKELPFGLIQGGRLSDKDGINEQLTALRQETGIRYAAVALPEEPAYVIRVELPMMAETELRDSIELQLEEHIPVPATDVIFDYEIYRRPTGQNGHYDLGVSVFPKALATEYAEVFERAGITPIAFEIETASLARTFVSRHDKGTTMIVDVGKTRSSFCIVSRGIVLFSATVEAISGERITMAISRSLGIETAEAEQIKIEKGLLHSPKNQKIFEALIPLVSTLRDEIFRHYLYWQRQQDIGQADELITKIILCGGQAVLPGLDEYLSPALGVPVILGNPWSNVLNTHRQVPSLDFASALRYGTAIGLALRGIHNKSDD